MPRAKKELVEIRLIETESKSTQTRLSFPKRAIETYSEIWSDADEGEQPFPPIDLFFDGMTYWIGDGWCRTLSAIKVGVEFISANVVVGNETDAKIFACLCNHSHGYPTTAADKKNAVKTLLLLQEDQPEEDRIPNSEIARKVGVSRRTVINIRASLYPEEREEEVVDFETVEEPSSEPEPEQSPEPPPRSRPAPTRPRNTQPRQGTVTTSESASRGVSLLKLQEVDELIKTMFAKMSNAMDERCVSAGNGPRDKDRKRSVLLHLHNAYEAWEEWVENTFKDT